MQNASFTPFLKKSELLVLVGTEAEKPIKL